LDRDVKAYFLALSSEGLRPILTEYGRSYGAPAREYAERTIAEWRAGTVGMSGLVAERLFALLPPRMTPETKYKLVEELWRRTGPSSDRVLRVGLDATIGDVASAAGRHIEEVAVAYRIPPKLEKRFEWLSAGDASVKQQLLNALLELERAQVVEWIGMQMPVLLAHLKSDQGARTTRLAQIASIGKHRLEIVLDRSASGVRLERATDGLASVTTHRRHSRIRTTILVIAFLLAAISHVEQAREPSNASTPRVLGEQRAKVLWRSPHAGPQS
jgi:hypothetical protein